VEDLINQRDQRGVKEELLRNLDLEQVQVLSKLLYLWASAALCWHALHHRFLPTLP
jgi:hypothetical protein